MLACDKKVAKYEISDQKSKLNKYVDRLSIRYRYI